MAPSRFLAFAFCTIVSSAGNPVDPAAPILDALVFSARDEDERAWAERVSHRFRLLVATDGAHGLLTVCGVNPRAERMGNDQTSQQDEQGLTKETLRKKSAHSWLTAGVNV